MNRRYRGLSRAGRPPREEVQHLEFELHAAQREAATLRAQLLAAEAAIAESAAAASALTQDCAAGDRALAQLRAEHLATVLELELSRDDLVSAERAAAEDEQSEALMRQLRERHDEAAEKFAAAREDMMAHRRAKEQLRVEHRRTVMELENTRQALRTCQQEQEQLQAEHRETGRELDATQRNVGAREQAMQQLRSQHAVTVADIHALQHDLRISRQEADDADADRAAALQELRALREDGQRNAHMAEELRRGTQALRAAVERSQRELAAGEHEADALQQEHAVRLASRVGMSRARCCLR